jgi:SSS family solute:Na+ symporter
MDGFMILAASKWGWPDWLTLGLFFFGMVLVVWYSMRQKEETSADYFLAGRAAGWLAIGSSIWASNIGSEHLVGLAGAGAKTGLAMSHWEIQAWLILVLGWVFVPYYSRSRVFTMPEFLEKRFCTGARTFLSLISLVSYVLTKVAVTVWAGGIVFTKVLNIKTIQLPLLGNVDFFWFCAIGLVVITGIYTVIGGMKAVLYTSVLQVPVMLIGSIIIVAVGLWKLGGGEGFIAGWKQVETICGAEKTQYGDSMLNIIRSAKDPNFPWTGVLLGSAIIGFWYWCTDQYIVQRVLSAPNQKEARRGSIFGAYLKLTPVFIFMIPGLIAFALHQKGIINLGLTAAGRVDSDGAFPVLVREILPLGIKGIVVGGMVAALMSSLASLFNSSATLFTVDFYKKYRPQSTEKHLVFVGRTATATVTLLGLVWIPLMTGLGNVLYEYLQDVQSLIAPGIAMVFIVGVFSKRATGKAGLWGLIISFILGMFRLFVKVIYLSFIDKGGTNLKEYIANHLIPADWGGSSVLMMKFLAVNWLHYCIFLFFLTLVVIWVVSLFTKKPAPEQIQGLTYGSATREQIEETRRSWGFWDVVHTLIILAIVVGFYIYFW